MRRFLIAILTTGILLPLMAVPMTCTSNGGTMTPTMLTTPTKSSAPMMSNDPMMPINPMMPSNPMMSGNPLPY